MLDYNQIVVLLIKLVKTLLALRSLQPKVDIQNLEAEDICFDSNGQLSFNLLPAWCLALNYPPELPELNVKHKRKSKATTFLVGRVAY